MAWRAHELWQRDAATARLHSQVAAALLRHLRQVDPDLSPATVEDLRAALDRHLHQLEIRSDELRDVLRSNRRRSIKDYCGAGCRTCSSDGRRYRGPSTW